MKAVLASLIFILISGCAASVASKYGTSQDVDKFNSNQTTVTMSGGVIDADYLGIVSNPAKFNPFVIRSANNQILNSGISFSYETTNGGGWLNIGRGSTATFLLNGGSDKVVLSAATGDIDFNVSAPQSTVYTKKYDAGVFRASIEQLRKISYASDVEVRVIGASNQVDFPRRPNNKIVKNFLPNFKQFYETEIQPYTK